MEVELRAEIHIRTCMHKNNLLMSFEMYVYVCVCICMYVSQLVRVCSWRLATSGTFGSEFK